MDKPTITLHRDVEHDCWTATCDAYLRLFGTATLPTPFMARASAEAVLAEIQRTNPAHRVVLA